MYFHVHKPRGAEGIPLILAQALATLVVDLLRLLYSLGSNDGWIANKDRLGLFISLAEQHVDDLRAHLARGSNSINPAIQDRLASVERNCRWVLGQVKHRDDPTFDLPRCFSTTRKIVADVYVEIASSLPEELAAAEARVIPKLGGFRPAPEDGGAHNLRLRHTIQQLILTPEGLKVELRTVAHDVEQSLSFYYFLIDRWLLSTQSSNRLRVKE